jgi:hypothetical protein
VNAQKQLKRGCQNSSAVPNEVLLLELPGYGERADSSRSSGSPEEGGP